MSEVTKDVFGEFNPDGSVKSEPSRFVSGRPFVVGLPSVRERVSGTEFFYRVEAHAVGDLTDAQREILRAAVPQPLKSKSNKASEGRESEA